MRDTKAYWNERVDKFGYDAVGSYGTRGKKQEAQYQNTIAFLSKYLPTDKTIFEYGCGVGRLCEMFDPALYIGMDISDKMIKVARQKHPAYTFQMAGEKPRTDITLTANVLQHNPDSFVKEFTPNSKELYAYELIGKSSPKDFLFPRSVKEYEELLGLELVATYQNKSHTLMHYVVNS